MPPGDARRKVETSHEREQSRPAALPGDAGGEPAAPPSSSSSLRTLCKSPNLRASKTCHSSHRPSRADQRDSEANRGVRSTASRAYPTAYAQLNATLSSKASCAGTSTSRSHAAAVRRMKPSRPRRRSIFARGVRRSRNQVIRSLNTSRRSSGPLLAPSSRCISRLRVRCSRAMELLLSGATPMASGAPCWPIGHPRSQLPAGRKALLAEPLDG
mmetsp:Transcript_7540/g.22030  ORF Transcript_7540/g.22030 Transcript_7540/m.22030 type:complete len:214 (+) Transcript_7540:3624-4265(+)